MRVTVKVERSEQHDPAGIIMRFIEESDSKPIQVLLALIIAECRKEGFERIEVDPKKLRWLLDIGVIDMHAIPGSAFRLMDAQ